MLPLAYYERWVNGAGLRSLHALLSPRPRRVPASVRPETAVGTDDVAITLSESPAMAGLPVLNADRLHPVPHVILHGSQATHDACGFSDVDVVAVIEDRVDFTLAEHAAAVQELQRLLRAIFRYDSLMHHGLMFFAASALDAYDQSFLPLDTLRCAVALHGSRTIVLHTKSPDEQSARARVRRSADVLLGAAKQRRHEQDDFAFKQLLSNVLLMPALLCAARGQYVYKRDSFDLARGWFSKSQWQAVARAEEYRRRWDRPPQSALAQWLGDCSHPSMRVRWSAKRPPRGNVRRLLATSAGSWREDLERTLVRCRELAA